MAMILSDAEKKFLGFSSMEEAILEALSPATSASYSVLAASTKLPRTSLYTAVRNLLSRGFIKSVKKGKRTYFMSISQEEIHEVFAALAEKTASSGSGFQTKTISKGILSGEYLTYRGLENLVTLYEKFFSLPRYSRIYGIQPNVSAYSLMKNFPYERLVRVNKEIKRRKIIVEGILQENFLEYYRSHLVKEGKPVRDIFDAYGGRLADTGYVPKEFFNYDSELMMTDSFAVIANWKELVAVEIRDREIVGLLKQMFAFIKASSKKVDQNPAVAKLLQEEK